MNILMTVEELAKYLKIKPDTIYKKVRRGELPAVKLGKLLRFPKELIDQWVAEQSAKTAKARKALTNKVEEVVDEVNKRAKAASKVMGDVPDLFEDVKKAPLSKIQETLSKGLRDLWKDLNKGVVSRSVSTTGARSKVAKTAKTAKKRPARSGVKKKLNGHAVVAGK